MDNQERTYCKAVSWQGLDPYAMTREEEERFIAIANRLPEGIWEGFFLLTSLEDMQEQADKLVHDLDWIAKRPGCWDDLKRIRDEVGTMQTGQLPWNQGYDLARRIRKSLGLNGGLFPASFDTLAEWFHLSPSQLMQSVSIQPFMFAGLEAVVGENENGSPGFILRQKVRLENQIFAFGRALCDYLAFPHRPSLVSEAATERQKRNRAFAAELLAPAESIQKKLSGLEVNSEQIDEIACQMGVSSFVVEHQVKNHRLAVIKEE